MLKFIIGNEEKKGNVIGLGLSHRNLELLRDGKPIFFEATELLHGEIKQILPGDSFFIFADKDEQTMIDALKKKYNFDKTSFRDFRTDHSGNKVP